MKKIFFSTVLLMLFLFTNTHAQSSAQAAEPRLGIGLDLGLPIGDFGDFANYGVGGSILYQHPVSTSLNITGNVGYIKFNGKQTIGTLKYMQSFIPIKVGARYFLTQNIYGTAEVGSSIATTSGSGASFIYTPGLGFEIPVSSNGSLDIGARYESWTKNTGTISFIGIRAGYNF
ncbi:outer membrane beta-barrel protein [Pedobacter foliorum]|uniref:outer membrane beta-barrel protein n=1 Tax=Pedobacter foliorum TaxID=2739058 RepID=UPI0015645643|nr:outer membrane beta-barrel protein [Pedobacter foliorum]NRF40988.1 outer membrane beta-barrel protein [Pedobacter foliorum]